MGQVSTLFVHKVVDAATADDPHRNTNRRELFQSVGVDPDALPDPKLMIPDTDYYDLCERVMDGHPLGVSLPIKVGASMLSDDYGAFGLAWKSAVNLRGSYQRAERYGRVLTSVSTYEVQEEDGKTFMALHRAGERRRGLFISNEQTIVAVAQISREVCGQAFSPEAVFFEHPAPDDTSAHEACFGCPVHFDAGRNALQVSAALLQTPNRLGDARISEFFDAHMDKELQELPEEQAFDRKVRVQISQALSEGVPSVSDIASRLGLSARTLQRRLSEQGFAFGELVDHSRRDLAERLLRQSDYALAEVAFLTGFAEQSTFTRAFKRWRGETPAAYRRNAAPA